MTGKSQTRTLGKVSARFIYELKKMGKSIFNLDEATAVYGRKKQDTVTFLSTLIKRGVLFRINAGVYLILEMGHENTQVNNWPVIASQLIKDKNYYISYYSAMRIHGMTTHPSFDVYITTPKRYRGKRIGNINYHFIFINPNFFWGFETLWITRQDKIMISDIEKTILDGFDRPDLSGGIKEVIKALWSKQNEINWEKLLEYTERFHSKAAAKRLGFILETINLGDKCSLAISKIIQTSSAYCLFDPTGPKQGKYIKKWRICLNINIDELKASVWS